MEHLMQDSPTYSNRQSRISASPKYIYAPRYNQESGPKKPTLDKILAKDKVLYTFGGEVLFSKVIKEKEEKT